MPQHLVKPLCQEHVWDHDSGIFRCCKICNYLERLDLERNVWMDAYVHWYKQLAELKAPVIVEKQLVKQPVQSEFEQLALF